MRPNLIGRRQSERRECSIKAQAHFYDGSPPADCLISDFSTVGAKLIFPPDREPPSAFDLHVPSRGDTRHALVRWKTPDGIGVEFMQSRGSTADQRMSDLLLRVARIEEQMRALRADAALSRGAAAEDALPAAPPAAENSGEITTLTARVAALEARNNEMLGALKQTLALLGELRAAPAPTVNAP